MVYKREILPFDSVVIATGSLRKCDANRKSIEILADRFGVSIPVDSVDPEIFEQEGVTDKPEIGAWRKTEIIRENVEFKPDQRTLLLAFDVVTILHEPNEAESKKQGVELHRLLREITLDQEGDVREQWQAICNTLELEKTRMIERCTNGAFCIEWHIGFALNSSDQKIASTGVVVLRATFASFTEEMVVQAFALSEDLQLKRANGELPTEEELSKGVVAFAIGPRLPFVKYLHDYTDSNELAIENRDHEEGQAVLSPEQFFNLVCDCGLSPEVLLQLLAGSDLDTDGVALSPLHRPTVPLHFT